MRNDLEDKGAISQGRLPNINDMRERLRGKALLGLLSFFGPVMIASVWCIGYHFDHNRPNFIWIPILIWFLLVFSVIGLVFSIAIPSARTIAWSFSKYFALLFINLTIFILFFSCSILDDCR